MPQTKQQLRSTIAAKRKMLDADWIEDASAKAIENLQSLPAFQSAKTVALYMAIGGEVRLEPLFAECWRLGKTTCIPVFNSSTRLYEMAEITENTRFETGNYGIPEPVAPNPVAIQEINLMVVPGVAFDASGNRLGRGGGYYDRLLDGFSGDIVAVAFDFQILPQIPCDSYDRPVQIIATETKNIKVRNER
ncbi:5-formyltetrahydrofolate cyclo-ligase [Pontiella sulfatireligans]|uniref:5-formyltetrahydrofolate cyclo-ligase n=1 Tax=Pontiella sulfatireligans TaxID=2750658 RepID=A0A6C2UJR7_9BACT|nr:5-formyltetrahydrofolate cyclo-ligase [Pontiella sulfatireligans]VGO20123.1 5-formyltetrahydrofolate cyclo-ligase [Pontiella sulfatireligans]